MSDENPIDENDPDTEVPSDVQQLPESADIPVGILRMNLERKLAAKICVLLFLLYGIFHAFQPQPEQRWESVPTAGESEGEGEHMDDVPVESHVIWPAPL